MNESFDPYIPGAWPYLLRALNWAKNNSLNVILDLHGAPGSQNGQPHSGISDSAVGLFNNDDYINKTRTVLKFLVQNLENVTNIVGIQILNEPVNDPSLETFCAFRMH